MLKINIETGFAETRLSLQGKLTGEWVNETHRVWDTIARQRTNCDIVVDLREVIFVNPEGKELLRDMLRSGVKLEGARLLVKNIVDELKAERRVQDCA